MSNGRRLRLPRNGTRTTGQGQGHRILLGRTGHRLCSGTDVHALPATQSVVLYLVTYVVQLRVDVAVRPVRRQVGLPQIDLDVIGRRSGGGATLRLRGVQ